ncbi:MAG: hypothetical protein ISR65_16775 [Bacteriovoracaceae bacterium]|nr:hypothetical protein [Bacteriovoracaceae bacterium]
MKAKHNLRLIVALSVILSIFNMNSYAQSSSLQLSQIRLSQVPIVTDVFSRLEHLDVEEIPSLLNFEYTQYFISADEMFKLKISEAFDD